jgi:hypothetical protein
MTKTAQLIELLAKYPQGLTMPEIFQKMEIKRSNVLQALFNNKISRPVKYHGKYIPYNGIPYVSTRKKGLAITGLYWI